MPDLKKKPKSPWGEFLLGNLPGVSALVEEANIKGPIPPDWSNWLDWAEAYYLEQIRRGMAPEEARYRFDKLYYLVVTKGQDPNLTDEYSAVNSFRESVYKAGEEAKSAAKKQELYGAELKARETVIGQGQLPPDYGLARSQALQGIFREPTQEQFGGVTQPSPTEAAVFAPFLESMSPAMRQHFGYQAGAIAGEFESKFPGAREAWWATMFNPAPITEEEELIGEIGKLQDELARLTPAAKQYEAWSKKYEDPSRTWTQAYDPIEAALLGERGVPTPVTTQEQLQLAAYGGAQRLPGEIERAKGALQQYQEQVAKFGAPPQETYAPREDPFKSYLEQYPFAQKFLSTAPTERGFYSGLFTPRTKRVT